jgi:hypothetical protein
MPLAGQVAVVTGAAAVISAAEASARRTSSCSLVSQSRQRSTSATATSRITVRKFWTAGPWKGEHLADRVGIGDVDTEAEDKERDGVDVAVALHLRWSPP